MEKKTLLIILVAVVIIAVAAIAVVATSGDDSHDSKDVKNTTFADSVSESDLEQMKELAANDNKITMTVVSGDSSVVFDSSALLALSAGSLDVKQESVPETFQGAMADAAVYSVTFGDNATVGNGKVTVTLPYSGKTDGSIDAYYLDGSNYLVSKYDCTYKDGKVSFTSDHLPASSVAVIAVSDGEPLSVSYSGSVSDSDLDRTKNLVNVLENGSAITLTVTSGESSVTFDSKAISTLSAASLEMVQQSVPEVYQGVMTDSVTYSVTFGENTSFGGGKATVTLPYSGKTKGTFDVYYIDSSNAIADRYDGTYANGKVSFTTGHFSTYAVNFVNEVRFEVYGNANCDDVLDANDATFLSNLLSLKDSGINMSRYTYADANYDGKIDEADVSYIQDLIDYKDGTKAYFLDAENDVSSVTFPFQSYGLLGTSTLVAALVLDLTSQVKSLSNSSSKDPLYSQFWEIGDKNGYFSNNTSSFDYGLFSKVQQSLGKNRMDGVIACMPMGYSGLANLEDNEYVDLVKLPFSSARDVGSYLILGYLTGKVDRAVEYAALSDSITDKIAQAKEKHAGDLTEVLPAFGSATMGGGFVTFLSPDTQYSEVMADAGAKIIKNGGEQSIPGQSTVSVKEADWLADPRFNTLDSIVCMVQGTMYVSEAKEYQYEYQTIMSHDGYAYMLTNVVPEHFYIVNWSLPYPIMLAYLFECFYPDDVDAGYGDTIHQEFYDRYFSGSSYGADFKITEHKFFFGYEDLKDLA